MLRCFFLSIIVHFLVFVATIVAFTEDLRAQYRQRVIMYSGQEAPGANGAVFSTSGPVEAFGRQVGIGGDGRIVFRAVLEGGDTQVGVNDLGLWVNENDTLRLLVRLGEDAPGLPNHIVTSNAGVFVDSQGSVGFTLSVSDGQGSQTVFCIDDGGQPIPTITQGMPVAGTNLTASVNKILAYNAGRVLQIGILSGPGVNGGNNVALLLFDPDKSTTELNVIARKNNAMVGVDSRFRFKSMAFPGANILETPPLGINGDVIFNAEGVDFPPGNGDKIYVVYRWTNGQLSVIKASSVNEFGVTVGDARMNISQQAAFHGPVAFPSPKAIWHEGMKATPLVTEGDVADGAAGRTFSGFNDFVLTDAGRIIVQAVLEDNSQGIWIEDEAGVLRKVAMAGDAAPDVKPGFVFGRVNNLTASASGQIAFSDVAFDPTTFEDAVGLWVGDLNGLNLVAARGDSIAVAENESRFVREVFALAGIQTVRTGADGHSTLFGVNDEVVFLANFEIGKGHALIAAEKGLVVNSTADIADQEAGNGICDTGRTITRNGAEEPECTLRAAIEEANILAGTDKITFNIPGSGPHTIQPETPLPEITDAVSLIGPPMEVILGKGLSAREQPPVTLDGLKLSRASGLQFGPGSVGSILENVAIINFPQSGVLIGADNIRISGCYIGVNPGLTKNLGNGGDGIQIQGGKGALIGGSANFMTRPKGNVIAFNRNGILICDNDKSGRCSGSEATIVGNRILENIGEGVFIDNSAGNTIGGITAKFTNIIAGNLRSGIRIEGAKATVNKIQGNFIGIDPLFLVNSPRNDIYGIHLIGADSTTVGGQTNQPGTAPGNIILGRSSPIVIRELGVGVFINQASNVTILGNTIGTDALGLIRNENARGIWAKSANGLKIGGVSAMQRNLIIGSAGILLSSCEAVQIQGNWFGLEPSGKQVLPTGTSIIIRNGSKHQVGGRFLTRPGLPPGNVFAGKGVGIFFSGVKDSFIRGNIFGAGSEGETLQDESLNTASLFGGIELSQVTNIQIGGKLGDGNSFVNVITGIKIDNKSVLNTVRGNRFGETLSRQPATMKTGIRIFRSSKNTIGGSEFGDRNFITNASDDGILLQSTKENKIINNVLTRNMTGIFLNRAVRDKILNNEFFENKEAIKGDLTTVFIKNNKITASSGSNTGISFSASEVTISGNNISDDAGDAIHFSDGSQATVVQNNLVNNAGFGLNNSDASVLINAQSNWWGDASGPGGVGSGAGDAVSSGVDFNNWLAEPISLVAAIAVDSLFVEMGQIDTVQAFVRNWAFPTETVEVTLADDQGWLDNGGTQQVSLDAEFGAGFDISISAPAGTPLETIDRVVLTATSQTDPTVTAVDSLLIEIFEPFLASISVAPDTAFLAPGETQLFSASGLDQQGRPFSVDPVWSAGGGTIDAEGLFTAGSNAGTFAVSAMDTATQIEGSALVIISGAVSVEEETAVVPKAFRLYQAYPNPFNPSATITYDVKTPARVVLKVYNFLGQQVAVLVDSDRATGRYRAVFDASRFSSGVYIYAIQMDDFSDAKKMTFIK